MSTTFITATPEQSLRARCQAVWESGDFGVIARYTAEAAAEFVSRLELEPGTRFLDLACGTGNVACPAARAGCRVTGLDSAPRLIAQARVRTAAEGLDAAFVEGDMEELPFPDAAFDGVASMFGVMFAPRPEEALAESLRVCRPGGTVALAHWTPGGLVGEQFRIVSRHVSPVPMTVASLRWGEEETLRRHLGDGVSGVRIERRMARLRYPFPPGQAVHFLRQFYGPTLRAFAALDAEGQKQLHAELEDLFHRHNLSPQGDAGTVLDAEYLEVRATRSSPFPADHPTRIDP